MRNAPSVSYPVGHCAFYGWVLLGLGASGWAACAGVHVLALLEWAAPLTVAESILGVLLCLCWAGGAAWLWRKSPQGRLHWDAMAASRTREAPAGLWRWQPAGRMRSGDLARVVKVLDLQGRCLLWVLRPEGGAHWLWVERAQDPIRWDDLRRALVAVR